jgi:magnesium transporter
MARTRLYRHGVLDREDLPVADISEVINEPGVVVWLDLCSADGESLESIEEEFGLHTLAIEDASQGRQRPKVDHYATHLFVNAYEIELDESASELTSHEISMFVLPNALITVRKDREFDIDDVVARWDNGADLAKQGVGFLLYGVLDHIVDGHFVAVQDLDEKIDALEDELFEASGDRIRDVQRKSFALRKNLLLLRRYVLPMREVVNGLMRRDLKVVGEPLMPYYQDVYDHVLRATEWTESLRDMVSTILETNLTVQGNRMNLIMKKVTSWAAIIAIPTAVTGFYGQNLPYPGFNHESGFIVSTSLIVVGGGVLYWIFRRKDWL